MVSPLLGPASAVAGRRGCGWPVPRSWRCVTGMPS